MALLPPPLGYLCCDSAPCLESSRPFPAPTPRARPAPPPSGSSQSKTYPRTRVAAQLMGRRGTTTPGVSCGGSPCAPSALCWPCCGGCKPHPCREAPSTAHAWRRRGRPYLAGKLGAGSTAPHGIRVPFTLRLCCGTGSHPHVVPAGVGGGCWDSLGGGGQLGPLIRRAQVTPAAPVALGVGASWVSPLLLPFPTGLGYVLLGCGACCPPGIPTAPPAWGHWANCSAVGIPCPTAHAPASLPPRPDPVRSSTRGPDTRINEFPKRGGPGEGRVPAQEKALNAARRGQSGPGRPTARPYVQPHLPAHGSAAHRESDPIPGTPRRGRGTGICGTGTGTLPRTGLLLGLRM